MREGGFKIALVARLSAIPGHCMSTIRPSLRFLAERFPLVTTAIFSTCGMNIFVFSIAAILSMPKQFVTVYLGVLLEQSAEGLSTSWNWWDFPDSIGLQELRTPEAGSSVTLSLP